MALNQRKSMRCTTIPGLLLPAVCVALKQFKGVIK